MNAGIVVLCRYESSRLPGKILRPLAGRAILSHIVGRLQRHLPNVPVVVATSDEPSDDPIASFCRRADVACYRGPLDDVSGRFLGCAQEYGWDFAVRINGDNVFVDPSVVGSMVTLARATDADFVTNVPGRTFGYGMSVEVVRTAFYAQARAKFTEPEHREHVTSWLYEHEDEGTRHVHVNETCPELTTGVQFAIDTEDDFARATRVLELAAHLGIPSERLTLRDVATLSGRVGATSPWRGTSGPLLIAEIGGNHEGDFEYAKHLVREAIRSEADCIKFQIYSGDGLVSPAENPIRNKHFKKFELTKEQHIELAEMCREAGRDYLASVWDEESLGWIDPYLDYYKIGSGDVTAWPVLAAHARRSKPLILSTGLSRLDEVIETVAFLRRVNPVYEDPAMLCVLQCTSMYPIPETDAQLRVMDAFRGELGVSVGYSDHTVGADALVAATAMGAEVLEFHFTDSREGKTFRDHLVSLTADEVLELKRRLEKVMELRGNGVKVPQPSELEAKHETTFRRGVYTNRNVAAGETIQESDLVVLRPCHGTDARDHELVIGTEALRDIEAFAAIRKGVDFD